MVASTTCCLRKQFKSIIKRWFRRRKKSSSLSSSTSNKDNNPQCHNQTEKEHDANNKPGATMNGIHNFRMNGDASRDINDLMMSLRGCCLCRHRSLDGSSFPSTASASRNPSRKINDTRSKSRERYDSISSLNSSGSLRMPPHLQSRSLSRRNSTPIMYSNSSGRLKPPPIEKKLECTLEELFYGCKKNIKITRDVITDIGEIVQEEELLTINVQPGWKKGTKIKFDGKGNDRPGAYREDIVFFISEKRHQLFRREEDDLKLGVEIPLLKALTGCTISVPLLGGDQMKLRVDDVIYPGYEKIITGQGMPISKEPENRGNLRIAFLVEFPKHLTENQRSEVFAILQGSS